MLQELQEDDPITLQPLSELPYPPFELFFAHQAAPGEQEQEEGSAAKEDTSNYFDGGGAEAQAAPAPIA